MKRIVLLMSFCMLALFSSCNNDDNALGHKAEDAWLSFVQKDLIGDWSPQKVELKPIIGEPLMSIPYPNIPNCDVDVLTFRKDFTGGFTKHGEACASQQIPFYWKHRLGVIIFQLSEEKIITSLLLKKSPKYLVLDFKAADALPILKQYYPDIVKVPEDQLALLVVKMYFVKK